MKNIIKYGIFALMSAFMGAVIALQTASNMDNPLLPSYTIGYITRSSTILEFSPTIISLILAGKVGSNIASEVGTMRVTEQIDALEIMGINAAGYLILPKIIAGVVMVPVLVTVAIACALVGGLLGGALSGAVTPDDYIDGIRGGFNGFTMVVAMVKATVFGFIIASIPAYKGFYVRGGALEVGQAGTRAVVIGCISILACDYLITALML